MESNIFFRSERLEDNLPSGRLRRPRQQGIIPSMLLGVTFGESIALLVLTAALTGVLAPFVVQLASRRRLIEQRRFDEELKRETAFFDAQTQFLKELAAAIYDYLEKALAVSYAAHLSPRDFEQVWDTYNAESFALLGRIAAQVSMARTLFSSATADRLQTFYSDSLEDVIDLQLSRMGRNRKTTRAEWAAWHDEMHKESQRTATALLGVVAKESGLTYEQRRQHPASPRRFDHIKSWFSRPKEIDSSER